MKNKLKQHEGDYLHINKKHLVVTALIIYFIFNMTCVFTTVKTHKMGTPVNWFELFDPIFSCIGAIFMPFCWYEVIYGDKE